MSYGIIILLDTHESVFTIYMKLYNLRFAAGIGIVIFAFLVRFWALGSVPLGFHEDEAAFGYNAYSLLMTGRDEYGVKYPLIMKSFSDYKGAVYSYITVPFIAAFGLNEWSVRAPSAFFGVLFVILTYLFVYKISRNFELAIISMALAAISPTGILLSRIQSDPIVSISLFYLSLYLWLVWVQQRKAFLLAGILTCIFLSFFTNTVTRIFSIPILLLLALFYWKQWDAAVRKGYILVVFFTVTHLTYLTIFSSGARLTQVSVFSKADVQLLLEEEIREDTVQGVPYALLRGAHNKITAYGRYLLKNYTDYLSFDFLFYQAKQPQREQIPGVGIMLLIELPFLLAGIYSVIRFKQTYGLFSILWVLLVPLVVSFASDETPNIHRFFLALLPIHILVASGIVFARRNFLIQKPAILITLTIFLFSLNEMYYLHQLFIHQPVHSSMYRQAERKELALSIKPYYATYDVIVSQKILEHILFFWKYDPEIYQQHGSPRDTDNSWYQKFFFVTDACPSKFNTPLIKEIKADRILYIDKAECGVDPKDILIDTIRFKNSLDAYYLVEKSPLLTDPL